MAQLLVRNLNEDLVRKLKLRAAKNGRSAEAEHREILEQALTATAPTKPPSDDFWARVEQLRAELTQTSSAPSDPPKPNRQQEFLERMKRIREETKRLYQPDDSLRTGPAGDRRGRRPDE